MGTDLASRDEIMERAALVGVFLMLAESLDYLLIERVLTYLPPREAKVLRRGDGRKGDLRQRCSDWLLNVGALTAADRELIGDAVRHRNELAHESGAFLLGMDSINIGLLTGLRELCLGLQRWWFENVDWMLDPEQSLDDVIEVKSGTELAVDYILARVLAPAPAPDGR